MPAIVPDARQAGRRPSEPRRFALVFAAASLVALGTAWLLPEPPPPVRPAVTPAPPPPGSAAEQVAVRERIVRLRAERQLRPLAEALERLHALTGAPAALREAMLLHRDLGEAAAAEAALERLVAAGAASEAETLRLAAGRAGQGDAAGAIAVLTAALRREPSPELALRATLAAAGLPDPGTALRPLGALLGATAPDLLEALRVVMLADARPDLALLLLEGLPAEAHAAPRTAFLMAEAEARAGWRGAALARLLALRATDGLPPGAGALLIELALREGRLALAVEVAALLPVEAWPPALPWRLVEAARAAGRVDLLRPIDPLRLEARPDAAAVLALAQGEARMAAAFATTALQRPPDSAEAAHGLALLLRDLGEAPAALARLRMAVQGPAPDAAALLLLAELATATGQGTAALPLLARWRESGPTAGEAWLRLALPAGRLDEAAGFLQRGGAAAAPALQDALALAAQRRHVPLAEAAAGAMQALPALPEGWSAAEIALTVALAQPPTAASLGEALDLFARSGEAAARDRLVRLLAEQPEITVLAAQPGSSLPHHPALARLAREAAGAEGEPAAARLMLLAMLAPREALAPLVERALADPARFGTALVLARLGAEGVAAGEAALRALLPRLDPPRRQAALRRLLAAAPAAAQPMLRGLAEAALGARWWREEAAAQARAARLAALRARAARPGLGEEERQEIAQRLAELGEAAEDAPAAQDGAGTNR